jgi:putative methionine-R-sulfoxide reductase with GAF domain
MTLFFLENAKLLTSRQDLFYFVSNFLNRTKDFVGFDRSAVFLVDPMKNEVWLMVGELNELRLPISGGIVGHVVRTGEMLNLVDVYQDYRFNPEIDKKTGYRTRNMLAMPIFNSLGAVIGVVELINKYEGNFRRTDEDILRSFCEQASSVMESCGVMDTTGYGVVDRQHSIIYTMNRVKTLLLADGIKWFMVDKYKQTQPFPTFHWVERPRIKFQVGVGVAGTTLETKSTVLLGDVAPAYDDYRYVYEIDSLNSKPPFSLISMPILDSSGEAIGVIQAMNKKDGKPFASEDEVLLKLAIMRMSKQLEGFSADKQGNEDSAVTGPPVELIDREMHTEAMKGIATEVNKRGTRINLDGLRATYKPPPFEERPPSPPFIDSIAPGVVGDPDWEGHDPKETGPSNSARSAAWQGVGLPPSPIQPLPEPKPDPLLKTPGVRRKGLLDEMSGAGGMPRRPPTGTHDIMPRVGAGTTGTGDAEQQI